MTRGERGWPRSVGNIGENKEGQEGDQKKKAHLVFFPKRKGDLQKGCFTGLRLGKKQVANRQHRKKENTKKKKPRKKIRVRKKKSFPLCALKKGKQAQKPYDVGKGLQVV